MPPSYRRHEAAAGSLFGTRPYSFKGFHGGQGLRRPGPPDRGRGPCRTTPAADAVRCRDRPLSQHPRGSGLSDRRQRCASAPRCAVPRPRIWLSAPLPAPRWPPHGPPLPAPATIDPRAPPPSPCRPRISSCGRGAVPRPHLERFPRITGEPLHPTSTACRTRCAPTARTATVMAWAASAPPRADPHPLAVGPCPTAPVAKQGCSGPVGLFAARPPPASSAVASVGGPCAVSASPWTACAAAGAARPAMRRIHWVTSLAPPFQDMLPSVWFAGERGGDAARPPLLPAGKRQFPFRRPTMVTAPQASRGHGGFPVTVSANRPASVAAPGPEDLGLPGSPSGG